MPDHLKPETDDLLEVDYDDNDEDREDDLDDESNKETAPQTPKKNQQEVSDSLRSLLTKHEFLGE